MYGLVVVAAAGALMIAVVAPTTALPGLPTVEQDSTGQGFEAYGALGYERRGSGEPGVARPVDLNQSAGPPPELVGLAPMTGVLPDGSACLGTVSNVFGTAEQAQNST